MYMYTIMCGGERHHCECVSVHVSLIVMSRGFEVSVHSFCYIHNNSICSFLSSFVQIITPGHC